MIRDIHRITAERMREVERRYRRWLARRFRLRQVVGWIAEGAEGDPLGSGIVWLRESQPRPGRLQPRMPYLMAMYTTPRARGRGVATAIVRKAQRWSRDRRYPLLTLHASDEGRPLYEKLGFTASREMRLELK